MSRFFSLLCTYIDITTTELPACHLYMSIVAAIVVYTISGSHVARSFAIIAELQSCFSRSRLIIRPWIFHNRNLANVLTGEQVCGHET